MTKRTLKLLLDFDSWSYFNKSREVTIIEKKTFWSFLGPAFPPFLPSLPPSFILTFPPSLLTACLPSFLPSLGFLSFLKRRLQCATEFLNYVARDRMTRKFQKRKLEGLVYSTVHECFNTLRSIMLCYYNC